MSDYFLDHEVKRIADTLDKLYKLAVKEEHEDQYGMLIIWIGDNNTMSANSVNLNLTAPFGNNVGVPVETNNNQPFTFTPANIQWALQSPGIVTMQQNPDGSATFTPVTAGSTGVAVTDTSTSATATGTITVSGSSVNNFAMSIQWNAPVSASGQVKK